MPYCTCVLFYLTIVFLFWSRFGATKLNNHVGSLVSDPSKPNSLVVLVAPDTRDSPSQFTPATVEEIYKMLRNLKAKKATGCDQLSVAVIKFGAQVLAPSIPVFVNTSLSLGIVSFVHKLADVRPLYKSGDRDMPTHFRPACCQSCPKSWRGLHMLKFQISCPDFPSFEFFFCFLFPLHTLWYRYLMIVVCMKLWVMTKVLNWPIFILWFIL